MHLTVDAYLKVGLGHGVVVALVELIAAGQQVQRLWLGAV